MGERSERRSYEQWCPVTRTLDLVGDRWTLLIVRDLCFGARRYAQLRTELRGISPTLLSQRLRRLVADGLVEVDDGCYRLTERGRELWPVIVELGRFGLATMVRRSPADAVHDHFPRAGLGFLVRLERLPASAFCAEVDLDGEVLGLVVGPPRPEVPPHFRVTVTPGAPENADMKVVGGLVTLWRVRHGHDTFEAAQASGRLELHGPAESRRVFCDLMGP